MRRKTYLDHATLLHSMHSSFLDLPMLTTSHKRNVSFAKYGNLIHATFKIGFCPTTFFRSFMYILRRYLACTGPRGSTSSTKYTTKWSMMLKKVGGIDILWSEFFGHSLSEWGNFQILMTFIRQWAVGVHPQSRKRAIVAQKRLHLLTASSPPSAIRRSWPLYEAGYLLSVKSCIVSP